MLENLTTKNSTTLELTASSAEEAKRIKSKFEDAKDRETIKGNQGFSTNFIITATESVVLIQGESIVDSLFIARDAHFISKEKSRELIHELHRLETEEKLTDAVASTKMGVFAHKVANKPLPKIEKAHINFSAEAEAIMEQQRKQTKVK